MRRHRWGPTPLPTVVLNVGSSPSTPGPTFGSATASGVVASANEASLAFDQGGLVAAVHVALGDSVKGGEVLVELDGTAAQLELDRAQRVVREMTSPAASPRPIRPSPRPKRRRTRRRRR